MEMCVGAMGHSLVAYINDWNIFNNCGLRSYLEKHERVEADNGYAPGNPEVCKTPKGCFHPEKKKEMRNRIMARQETLNSHVKNFGILKEKYRHKLEDHRDVFHAILVIIQIGIEFCDEPLFVCEEYCD